jgi:uncharacterized phage-like protein YoqJ
MAISKKKLRKINEIGDGVVLDILKDYSLRFAGTTWWEEPPENWNEDEKNFWDALFALKDKLTVNIINIIQKEKEHESI